MATHTLLVTVALPLLILAGPVCALAGPQDWNDFTNNFATDLAPIIVLFGEQASKQFLSESTSFWDNIIFGIAPIGIITAVISAIRLYGSSSLKAFIGRAQEAHGLAEAELCSSTSEDVCELWSNGGICRVFGRPRILEFFYIKGSGAFYPSFQRQVSTRRPPTCGIYPPKSVLCPEELPGDGDNDAKIYPQTGWEEIKKKTSASPGNANAQERGKIRAFAPYPNLSLNIGIKTVPPRILSMTALLGTLGQLSFFGYATWVTFYYPDLYEGESLPSLWSFCLAISGTVILAIGMVCCAMLIEQMSMERRFRDQASSQPTTMFWLQPGNQRVGDQLFNAFAYAKSKKTFMTSWKVDLENESQRLGIVRLTKSSFRLWVAIGSSSCGFVSQFLGLRGLHGSVALYQLGVTLCMAIVRALLRSGRLGADQNKLKQRRDIEEHELDWQAMNLENPDKEFEGGWYIDDLPSQLQRPKDGLGQEKPDTAVDDHGIDVAPGTQQIASFRIRRNRDVDTLRCANVAVSWIKHNEADGDQPNEAARILHYRASLAYLTGDAIQATEQRWNTKVRSMAFNLQRALQEAAEYIFSEMALPKGWRESQSLVWSTTCHLHERPKPCNESTVSTETPRSRPIQFSMYQSAGLWEVSVCQLEAALGLWYWSASQLPWAKQPLQRKVFMVERGEKKDALISAIRLWVTQTHHISPINVRLPWSTTILRGEQDFCQISGVAPSLPDSIPQVSADDGLARYYPSTLSVPLMTVLEPSFARQEISSEANANTPQNRPAHGNDRLDGICLSISTKSSLLQLVAQDLFGIFISRIADVLEPLDIAEPWTRRGQMSAFGMGDASADQSYLGLTNTHVRALADIFVFSGIGSREDALMTMIPPLLQRGKLPETDEVMESLLHTAKALRRNNKFAQGEKLLRWLIDNVPRKFQERAVRGLGELYRKAVRSTDPFDRHFGRIGFEAMAAMKVLSEGRQLFSECKDTVNSYLLAWDTLKETGRGPKAPLSSLMQTLEHANLARPLGLYIIEKYDMEAGDNGDMLGLLDWAIKMKCPELLEDLWDNTRISTNVWDNAVSPLLFMAIQLKSDTETLETLFDWPGLDFNTSGIGQSLLLAASETGHYQAVDLLLKRGVASDPSDAMILAVKNKHRPVVQRLLQAGASNLKAHYSENDRLTALHWAAGWDSAVVELLLDHGANSNAQDSRGRTPLHVAADEGNAESVAVLLKHGANGDTADHEGISPLRISIQRGHDAIVEMLIGNKSPSVLTWLLHSAVRLGKKKIVDILLAHGAYTDSTDDMGRSPLLMAVEEGLGDIAESLLEAKANPNTCSVDDMSTPLHAAIKSGSREILSIILNPSYAASVDLKVDEWQTPLALAVDLLQQDTVELLLQRKANPDAEYREDGNEFGTVLHLATRNHSAEIVNRLLTAGANVEAKDHAGRTPLLLALEMDATEHDQRNETIVDSLLRAKADPNVTQRSAVEGGTGSSALHLALIGNNIKMVELLVQHNVRMEVLDSKGRTPLLAALDADLPKSRQRWEIVRLLLAANANPHAIGGECGTALQAAARRGQEDIVHRLLCLVVDVNARSGRYGCALQASAAAWAGEEVVQMLLAAGADPTGEGGEYGSAVHAALIHGRGRVLKMLLSHGAKTETEDPAGLTPLLVAVRRGDAEAVRLLLKHGAKTESADGQGWSALTTAVGMGNAKLVKMLLERGADKEVCDERARTPLLVATEKGFNDVVRLLLEAGANVGAEGGIYGNAMRAAMYKGDEELAWMLRELGGWRQ